MANQNGHYGEKMTVLTFIVPLALVVFGFSGWNYYQSHKKPNPALVEPPRIERRYKVDVAETDMTLKKFAEKYGVSPETLMVWNDLPQGYVRVRKGEKMRTSYELDTIPAEPKGE